MGLISLGFTAVDAYQKTQINSSHLLDAGITALCMSTGPAGWAVGAGYLALDLGFKEFTGKGIGDHLDSGVKTMFGSEVIWDW